jgi:nucleoside-diphosphate-sugar epimerase
MEQCYQVGYSCDLNTFIDAGVDMIAHVASPTFDQSDDPLRDIIGKAINGTLSVLRSAAAHGETVKHVVVTSTLYQLSTALTHPNIFIPRKIGMKSLSRLSSEV